MKINLDTQVKDLEGQVFTIIQIKEKRKMSEEVLSSFQKFVMEVPEEYREEALEFAASFTVKNKEEVEVTVRDVLKIALRNIKDSRGRLYDMVGIVQKLAANKKTLWLGTEERQFLVKLLDETEDKVLNPVAKAQVIGMLDPHKDLK